MCGKFTMMASWAEVYDYANLLKATPNDEVKTFTPMRYVPVVHLGEDEGRLVTPMVWGFTDRKADGRRAVRNMHARGETVDSKTTWSDAFRYRRGVTFAKSFNEGKEMMIRDEDGDPTAKTWTQQWTIKPKNGKPIIIGVIFDAFDVGNSAEYEYAQVTVPANKVISSITDRMPVILSEDDLELWLGELRGPLEDVKDLIRTVEFDEAEWDIAPEDPTKKAPRPKKKRRSETDKPRLF